MIFLKKHQELEKKHIIAIPLHGLEKTICEKLRLAMAMIVLIKSMDFDITRSLEVLSFLSSLYHAVSHQ